MKLRQIGLGILAAAGLAFAASASAQPGEGGRMGPGAMGEQQGQHAGMQARMAQRMAQHQGQHGATRGAGAGGCAMGQQAGAAQDEHKH